MAIKYSKSTGGFYDDKLAYPSLPTDLVEVSEAQHQALLNAQSNGSTIAPDVNGNPVAVAPALSSVRATKVNSLSAQCRALITGGFTSSALGVEHSYPSDAASQQNLNDAMAAALASTLGESFTTPLWCAATGIWSFVPHTVAQIQQVHSDWVTFRLAVQGRLILAKSAVAAATTPAAVNAVAF